MMKTAKWMLLALVLPALLVLPAWGREYERERERDEDREWREKEEWRETHERREREEWDEVEETGEMIELMEHYVELTFELERSALLGVGSIADMDIPEQHKADILEGLLAEVETQGVRNAVHLALKDLYLEMENQDKALHHVRALVIESDEALVEQAPKECDEKWDEAEPWKRDREEHEEEHD